MAQKIVWRSQEIPVERLDSKVSRKVLAHMEKLMTVEVIYQTDGVGPEHSHVHEQITYVIEGKFRFKVGSEYIYVEKGDSLYLPATIPHGCLCIDAGRLLDVFTPERQDFLKEEAEK
jgi:quercetin dioxygenase-like cupin family protein